MKTNITHILYGFIAAAAKIVSFLYFLATNNIKCGVTCVVIVISTLLATHIFQPMIAIIIIAHSKKHGTQKQSTYTHSHSLTVRHTIRHNGLMNENRVDVENIA